MIPLKVKPLSVNGAYRGRRFATQELKDYKLELSLRLPKKIVIPEGKLKVVYIFGISSKNGDGDNLIKAFQDCVADKYGFNDKRIYKWDVEKVDVPKGKEFINFDILKWQ